MSRDVKGEKDVAPGVEQSNLPFDAVVVMEGSTTRRLSPAEFFALPLAERIQHVVQQRASFFASGEPVDAKAALAEIRRRRTQMH
jgi:hypothetical protein